jgi:hypothetical protein
MNFIIADARNRSQPTERGARRGVSQFYAKERSAMFIQENVMDFSAM